MTDQYGGGSACILPMIPTTAPRPVVAAMPVTAIAFRIVTPRASKPVA